MHLGSYGPSFHNFGSCGGVCISNHAISHREPWKYCVYIIIGNGNESILRLHLDLFSYTDASMIATSDADASLDNNFQPI